jgi:hypothetical protein
VKNHFVILVLYVDDLFLTEEEHLIAQTKREFSTEFEMKDLGHALFSWLRGVAETWWDLSLTKKVCS